MTRLTLPVIAVFAFASLPPSARAQDDAAREKSPGVARAEKSDAAQYNVSQDSICLLVDSAARSHGLPLEFFARVIWQESRFKADATGPVTRSGKKAEGIAQFMPATAAERRLLDPYDPVQALPKSAEFLQELHERFGNLGLAAAAYNAGPRRVQEWIEGTGGLPQETRSYVFAITGLSADDWRDGKRAKRKEENIGGQNGCGALVALLKRAPNPFVEQLEQRVARAATEPWGVQLAAGFSRDRALASYARAMKRFTALVGDRDPSILASRLRSRGTRTFYQVRIGANSRQSADELCRKLRRGGGACLVLRNGRG